MTQIPLTHACEDSVLFTSYYDANACLLPSAANGCMAGKLWPLMQRQGLVGQCPLEQPGHRTFTFRHLLSAIACSYRAHIGSFEGIRVSCLPAGVIVQEMQV